MSIISDTDIVHQDDEKSEDGQSTSRLGKLLALCKQATDEYHTLFVSTGGPTYARILFTDKCGVNRYQLLKVGDANSAFAQWLVREAFNKYHFVPSQTELGDVLRLTKALAREQDQETLMRRIAFGVADVFTEEDTAHDAAVALAASKDETLQETICIDLADDDGHIIVVSAEGWEIVQPHVYANGWFGPSAGRIPFVRPANMRPLPLPERLKKGEAATVFADLFTTILINVTPSQRPLVLAWLIGALNPTGPYTLLSLQGPEGSFKSTTADLLQRIIDPTKAERRKLPKEDKDLLIAALGGHVLSFDNLSGTLPTSVSDALCRLSNGGSSGSRTLYTDDDETVLSAKRPVILNGIDSSIVKGDLLDRTLLVDLERVEPKKRLTETEINRRFEKMHARLLGALCDALVAILAWRKSGETLHDLPRMADAMAFVLPAEGVLGLPDGAIRHALDENTERTSLVSLDASPLANAIEQFMSSRDEWIGSATELLRLLKDRVNDVEVTRATTWPKNANQLGGWLNRDATLLRRLGIAKEDATSSRRDGRKLRLYKTASGDNGDGSVTRLLSPTSAHEIKADAVGDNGDNTLLPFEEEEERETYPSEDLDEVAPATSIAINAATPPEGHKEDSRKVLSPSSPCHQSGIQEGRQYVADGDNTASVVTTSMERQSTVKVDAESDQSVVSLAKIRHFPLPQCADSIQEKASVLRLLEAYEDDDVAMRRVITTYDTARRRGQSHDDAYSLAVEEAPSPVGIPW